MKIAIYEPESFAGGMLTWGLHLHAGLLALGHEADLITFTRSGKPRVAWSRTDGSSGLKGRPSPYTHVFKTSDAKEALAGYDGIIQNDPISYLQDAAALKPGNDDTPDYLWIMSQASCPITTTVHCGDYNTRNFPFREQFRALPQLTGTVVTHSQTTFDAGRELWPDWKAITVPLPYESRTPVDAPGPDRSGFRRVGITGRYTAVKGHRALAAAFALGHLADDRPVDVDLWGFGDVTAGPSATVQTFEQLTGHGFSGLRDDGPAAQSLPWSVVVPDGTLRYRGGYLDIWKILDGLQVHVNLTTTVASGGAVEYSQLETMDAGIAQVSPVHRWEPHYAGEVISSVKRWPTDRAFFEEQRGYPVLAEIGEAVRRTYAVTDAEEKAAREHNRETVRRLHDPKLVAQAFIDALSA